MRLFAIVLVCATACAPSPPQIAADVVHLSLEITTDDPTLMNDETVAVRLFWSLEDEGVLLEGSLKNGELDASERSARARLHRPGDSTQAIAR